MFKVGLGFSLSILSLLFVVLGEWSISSGSMIYTVVKIHYFLLKLTCAAKLTIHHSHSPLSFQIVFRRLLVNNLSVFQDQDERVAAGNGFDGSAVHHCIFNGSEGIRKGGNPIHYGSVLGLHFCFKLFQQFRGNRLRMVGENKHRFRSIDDLLRQFLPGRSSILNFTISDL